VIFPHFASLNKQGVQHQQQRQFSSTGIDCYILDSPLMTWMSQDNMCNSSILKYCRTYAEVQCYRYGPCACWPWSRWNQLIWWFHTSDSSWGS